MTFTKQQLMDIVDNPGSTMLETRLAAMARGMLDNPRDEHHTMAELYEQRMLWNAVAVQAIESLMPGLVCKSWKHHDGEPCFGKTEPGQRWFIVTAMLPVTPTEFKQVSQHYPEADWDLFNVIEVPFAPHWDGHTPAEGNARLRQCATPQPPCTCEVCSGRTTP